MARSPVTSSSGPSRRAVARGSRVVAPTADSASPDPRGQASTSDVGAAGSPTTPIATMSTDARFFSFYRGDSSVAH